MSIGFFIILSAFLSCIGAYIDKYIIKRGIEKKDYFYYMCLTMIPFAAITLFFEDVRFTFGLIPILLLIVAMILRYIKQKAFVGCYRYLDPHEMNTYLTLALLIAFVIDTICGIKEFTYLSAIAILLVLVGVFSLTGVKLRINNLKKDLIIRILSEVAFGYIAYFILKYWSNAVYMLLLNLCLVLVVTPTYKISYHKKNKNIFLFIILQQAFGFTYTYINNYLSSNAVTYSSFVRPLSLILVTIFAFFAKGIDKKPTVKDIISILFVVAGVVCINL